MNDTMEFNNVELELENYKRDLVALYNQKMGNNKHSLEVVIEKHREGIYNVKIVGPEEVQFIEKGRGSGKFPPVDVMRDWVEKHITRELPRANQLAYLIGRKISIQGTTGNHYIEQCLNELNPVYNRKLQEALDKDVLIYENYIAEQINNIQF